MARELWYSNGHDSLLGLRDEISNDGALVSPRNQHTLELRNVVVTIDDPTDVLMLGMNRKMNTGLAALESLQLIGGFSDAAMMARIAPNTRNFQDGGYFHGAYGPRLRGQLPVIARRLRKDRSTRQAVAMVWDPMHDLYVDGIHDYPCTIYLSWVIRDGKLEQTTHMRSNDLWWGWTYDLVQFTMLQNTLARFLHLPSGPYTHYVDSFHYYLRDQEALGDLKHREDSDVYKLDGLSEEGSWEEVQAMARMIAYTPQPFTSFDEDYTIRWLAQALMRRGE